MMYFCFDERNCKFETLTKEQILAAINQAALGGTIDPDAAFITKVKEANGGGYVTFWVGTQAQYNVLPSIDKNCVYIITNSTKDADLQAELARIEGIAEGGAKSVLLWENKSLVATGFGQEKVALDLSMYSFVVVQFGTRTQTTASGTVTLMMESVGLIGSGMETVATYAGSQNEERRFTVEVDGVTFGAARRYNGSQNYVDNTALIPHRIYGIKCNSSETLAVAGTSIEIGKTAESGGYFNKDGTWVIASGVSCIHTELIPVNESDHFAYQGHAAEAIPSVIWYDKDGAWLHSEQYDVPTGMKLLIAPKGAKSARFCAYAYTDDASTLNMEVYRVETEDEKRKIVYEYKENGFWEWENNWIDASGYAGKRTNPVFVKSDDVFYYTGKSLWNIYGAVWYDINGRVIHKEQYTDSNNDPTTVTLTPPDGALLVRFYSFTVDTVSAPIVLLASYETAEGDAAVAVNSNYLFQKKYVACGDSFTEGDFTNADDPAAAYDEAWGTKKTYPYWIAKRNKMTLVNEAISGTTMYNNGNESAFSVNRYKQIPTDADYITICFGLNDQTSGAAIGTLNDTTNETFMGAWNVVLEYLITNIPYAKIGIIVPDAYCNDQTRQAIIDVAEYWGIPYLDMKGDPNVPLGMGGRSGVASKAAQLRDAAFRVSETNTHPNVKAHEYRSTIIESFLRRL